MSQEIPTKEITGYTEQWNYHPGDTIQFRVNCEVDTYRADIVRLQCGDTNPDGPGVKEDVIDASVNREYEGRRQEIHAGSRMEVPHSPEFTLQDGFTLQAMVCPTTPQKGRQGLLTKWSAVDESGYGLAIGEGGDLSLWLSDEDGDVHRINTNNSFEGGTWYFVAAVYDQSAETVQLYQEPYDNSLDGLEPTVETEINITALSKNEIPFVIAGYATETELEENVIRGNYNGKVDNPSIVSQPLASDEMEELVDGELSTDVEGALVASWDFSAEIESSGIEDFSRATDTSGNDQHGEFLHVPARGVTGYNWTGKEHDFTKAPDQYGAVHFHDDDVGDAKWDTDFEYSTPSSLESAAYAARLRTENDETYIPFFITPRPNSETENIAFLAPTASYLAYANDHLMVDGALTEWVGSQTSCLRKKDIFLSEHREYGGACYDTHADGSGVMYSSRKRPILNMEPKAKHWLGALPSPLWQYNGDLHLIDWLEEKDFEYDIITDHDLHQEGIDILDSFNVVLTGSHPEYYTWDMRNALDEYTDQGGRLMYMGANGFYWSIAFHPDDEQIIEVRRGVTGEKAWASEPGELYQSFDGDLGGLWRGRGFPPQELVGNGFSGHGFDVSSYYTRMEDSFKDEVEFIFDGVPEDEKIGDFGLRGGGAAGLELDHYDANEGTPASTYLLASSEEHTDDYVFVNEKLMFNIPGSEGSQNPEVRSDIVYFTTENDGAVFSTGSIAWCGALAHNEYDNNVSQITENVLSAFKTDQPLP